MKNSGKNIKKIWSRSAIMLGLLVGFLSLTVSSQNFDCARLVENTGTEQSEDQKEADTLVSSFDAITTSSAQFSFDHQSILIDVLPSVEEREEAKTNTQSAIYACDKVLKILFQRIISPNAP